MDQKLLQELKQQLLKEKADAISRIEHLEEGLNLPLQDSIHELSSYDNHPADLGSETFERGKDLGLRELAEIDLAKINDALDKIEQGTYGKCDICGEEIDPKRLKAMPSSTLCLNCRKLFEGEGDRHPRPIEEDIISPPFGGFMHDDSEFEPGDAEDEVMFDGEDVWQEVARFGTSDSPQDVPPVTKYPDVYHDADESVGIVEDVEGIPYEKNLDGMFYQDFDGEDDESSHREKIGYEKD